MTRVAFLPKREPDGSRSASKGSEVYSQTLPILEFDPRTFTSTNHLEILTSDHWTTTLDDNLFAHLPVTTLGLRPINII